MHRRPFSHHPQRALGQTAAQNLARRNHDHRLLSRVDGMKVRRRVIGEVHPDHDPVEATDRRHIQSIAASTDVEPAASWSNAPDPRNLRTWRRLMLFRYQMGVSGWGALVSLRRRLSRSMTR